MTEVGSHERSKKSSSSIPLEEGSEQYPSQFLKERHQERDNDQRGFLTPQDRELLINQVEGGDLTKEQRFRIRKRLKNGIKDFELISHSVEEIDKKMVFREIADEDDSYNYLAHLGALVYEAVDASGYDSEEFIEDSIQIAEDLDDVHDIGFVDINPPSKKEIKQRSD